MSDESSTFGSLQKSLVNRGGIEHGSVFFCRKFIYSFVYNFLTLVITVKKDRVYLVLMGHQLIQSFDSILLSQVGTVVSLDNPIHSSHSYTIFHKRPKPKHNPLKSLTNSFTQNET